MHPKNVSVRCVLGSGGLIGPSFFENDAWNIKTKFFVPQLNTRCFRRTILLIVPQLKYWRSCSTIFVIVSSPVLVTRISRQDLEIQHLWTFLCWVFWSPMFPPTIPRSLKQWRRNCTLYQRINATFMKNCCLKFRQKSMRVPAKPWRQFNGCGYFNRSHALMMGDKGLKLLDIVSDVRIQNEQVNKNLH